MRFILLILLVGAVAAVAPLSSHHSFAAHYFEEQSMTITGDLVEFEYRSPHAWVYVMAPDERGTMRRYGAEWQNPNRLNQQGITKDTLKPGDRVIVIGSPGRNAGRVQDPPERHRAARRRLELARTRSALDAPWLPACRGTIDHRSSAWRRKPRFRRTPRRLETVL